MSEEFVHYFCQANMEYKLMALVSFIRTHQEKDRIAVLCPGDETVKFICTFLNDLNLMTVRIAAKMTQKERKSAEDRFASTVNTCIINQNIAGSVKLNCPTWVIEYTVPPPIKDYIQLIKQIEPKKVILFVDPLHERFFIDRLEEEGLQSKELAFKKEKLPRLNDRLEKLLDKNYDFYQSSQFGYREMIKAYVNSENKEYNATQLNLLNAAITYGIRAPPKLPLTKQ